MSALLDFGKYTPYIGAAYGMSLLVIGVLIIRCRAKINKTRKLEKTL